MRCAARLLRGDAGAREHQQLLQAGVTATAGGRRQPRGVCVWAALARSGCEAAGATRPRAAAGVVRTLTWSSDTATMAPGLLSQALGALQRRRSAALVASSIARPAAAAAQPPSRANQQLARTTLKRESRSARLRRRGRALLVRGGRRARCTAGADAFCDARVLLKSRGLYLALCSCKGVKLQAARAPAASHYHAECSARFHHSLRQRRLLEQSLASQGSQAAPLAFQARQQQRQAPPLATPQPPWTAC